jgi:amidase
MLARRLRAAGAILIGKTNVPEFGLGSHSFNPVYGVTSNPYDGGVTAGGSSGGAAAALAARLVPVADGSDMMGSLRNPAAFCNVYGFRPSAGRVPSDPLGDAWLHMVATDGPMGRTVEDMARLLETLAVPDPANPHGMAWEPFAAGLGQAPAAPRIGWLGDWGGAYPMEAGILALCEEALAGMEAIGGRVTPLPPPFPAGRLWDSWTTLRSWAVGAGKAAYHADPARRALLKPEALWEIERGLALSAMAVHAASVARTEWLVRLSGLFEQYDVLALPSAQVWPFPKGWRHPETIAGRTMDSYHRWMEVVVPVSLAGLPCVSVPVGFGPSGLPMGLQLFGPRGVDRDVLRVAEAWHRATDWPGRRPPAAP